MSIADKLYETAQRWSERHRRTTANTIERLKEEIEEYEAAESELEKLDEVGDIITFALRILGELTWAEREFIYQNVKMKTDRRLIYPGEKNKEVEKHETFKIARRLRLF